MDRSLALIQIIIVSNFLYWKGAENVFINVESLSERYIILFNRYLDDVNEWIQFDDLNLDYR